MRSHKLQIFFITLILIVSLILTAGEQDPLQPRPIMKVKIATQENEGLMNHNPSVQPQIERSLMEEYFAPAYEKRTGVKLEITWVFYTNSQEILDAVRRGDADFGIGGVTKTAERVSEGHHFVANYMHVPMVFLGGTGQGLALGQLNECTGIVMKGTSYVSVAARETDKLDQVGRGESIPKLVESVKSGQGCVFSVIDATVAYMFMIDWTGESLHVFASAGKSWYAAVFRADHLEDLAAELNRYVEREKRQPAMHLLIQRQFGDYAAALLQWNSDW